MEKGTIIQITYSVEVTADTDENDALTAATYSLRAAMTQPAGLQDLVTHGLAKHHSAVVSIQKPEPPERGRKVRIHRLPAVPSELLQMAHRTFESLRADQTKRGVEPAGPAPQFTPGGVCAVCLLVDDASPGKPETSCPQCGRKIIQEV